MSSVPNDVKQRIISKYIRTAAGRAKLAASMIQPLRDRRDYRSVARKAFFVESLPDGALPIYDKDTGVSAYVVSEEGESILSVVKPKRVLIPLFEIACLAETPITQIKERRFDVVERSIDDGKAKIQEQEDIKAFAVMDSLAADAAAPNADIATSPILSAAILADAFSFVERQDIKVSNVFMNARDYADLRKFDRDVLDVTNQAVLYNTGMLAQIWGAKIFVTRQVTAGTVYVCGEPEFFGRIPVRTELTVLSADDNRNRTVGFSMFEQLGIGAYNGNALQRITITRA